jgi:hypothetical protein
MVSVAAAGGSGGAGSTLLLVVAALLLTGAALAAWVSNYQSSTRIRVRQPRTSRPPADRHDALIPPSKVPPSPAAPPSPVTPPALPPIPPRVVPPTPAASSLPPSDGEAAVVDGLLPGDGDSSSTLIADDAHPDTNQDPADERRRARRREELGRLADQDPSRLVDVIRVLLTDDGIRPAPKPDTPT